MGVVLTSQIPGQVQNIAQADKNNQQYSPEAKQAATAITTVFGGTVTLSFFLCTGIPAAVVCILFALVCESSWQAERRHREQLEAAYARNDILGNMATIQLAQAQMQHNSGRSSPGRIESQYDDQWEQDDLQPAQKPIRHHDVIITPGRVRRPGETGAKGQSTDDAVDKIRRYKRLD